MSRPLNYVPSARTVLIVKKHEDYVCDEALDIQFSMRNISFVPFILWNTSVWHNQERALKVDVHREVMFQENLEYLKSIGYWIFRMECPPYTLSGGNTSQVYVIANPVENITCLLIEAFPNEKLIRQ